jgi:hypothetical protein
MIDENWFLKLSPSIRHDYEIRQAMERCLRLSEEEVVLASKKITFVGKLCLVSCRLDWSFNMPAVSKDYGSNNEELRGFAFDAYDKLKAHFAGDEWYGEWEVATRFRESHEGESREFSIGVYV